MAKTVINLSDTVASLVIKTNTISDGLGDVAAIATGDSNVVDAINDINTRLSAIDDTSEIRALISVTDAGGDGSLTYTAGTGVITYTGPSASEVKAHFQSDSANGIIFNSLTGAFSLLANGLSHTKFKSKVSLIIYDSAGSPVKTIYSPGA